MKKYRKVPLYSLGGNVQLGTQLLGMMGGKSGIKFDNASNTLGSIQGLSDTIGGIVPAAQPITSAVSAMVGLPKMAFDIKEAKDQQRRAEALEKEANRKESINQSYAKLSDYPTKGVANSMFRMGGKLFALGGNIQTGQGGVGVPLSNDAQQMVGNSHEQGGIQLQQGQQSIAEVEGGEVINNAGGQPFVSSAMLSNPKTGNPFAEDMATLEREKRKYEILKKSRPDDSRVDNMIDKVQLDIDALAAEQEALKQVPQPTEQGIPPMSQSPMNGMEQPMLPKGQALMDMPQMRLGGDLPPSVKRNKGFDVNSLSNINGVPNPVLGRTPNAEFTTQFSTVASRPFNVGDTSQGLPKTILPKTLPMSGDAIRSPLAVARDKQFKMPEISDATAFIDNLGASRANAQREALAVPRQDYVSYLTPNLVNLDNQRQQANAVTRRLTQATLGNTSNSVNANALVAAMASQNIEAQNNVNRDETNQNSQIRNQFSQLNAGIEEKNSGIGITNRLRNFTVSQDNILNREKNMQNLGTDMQVAAMDKKREEADSVKNIMALMSNPDPRVIVEAEKSGLLDQIGVKMTPEQRIMLQEKLKKAKYGEYVMKNADKANTPEFLSFEQWSIANP